MTAPSVEVAVPSGGALTERIEYSRALAVAPLLPKSYRDQPGNVLLALELADSLGLSPMDVIQNVHVIEGKLSMSASLIAGLVRRAGHRLRVFMVDPQTARATITRADDPDFEFVSTWTMDRAKTAGLVGKDNWRHHPQQMLKRRATAEVARDACPEVLAGMGYDRDEVEQLPASARITVPDLPAQAAAGRITIPDLPAQPVGEPTVDPDPAAARQLLAEFSAAVQAVTSATDLDALREAGRDIPDGLSEQQLDYLRAAWQARREELAAEPGDVDDETGEIVDADVI